MESNLVLALFHLKINVGRGAGVGNGIRYQSPSLISGLVSDMMLRIDLAVWNIPLKSLPRLPFQREERFSNLCQKRI